MLVEVMEVVSKVCDEAGERVTLQSVMTEAKINE